MRYRVTVPIGLTGLLLWNGKDVLSVADPDPGSGTFLTPDPGWVKITPESRMNIPDNISDKTETPMDGKYFAKKRLT